MARKTRNPYVPLDYVFIGQSALFALLDAEIGGDGIAVWPWINVYARPNDGRVQKPVVVAWLEAAGLPGTSGWDDLESHGQLIEDGRWYTIRGWEKYQTAGRPTTREGRRQYDGHRAAHVPHTIQENRAAHVPSPRAAQRARVDASPPLLSKNEDGETSAGGAHLPAGGAHVAMLPHLPPAYTYEEGHTPEDPWDDPEGPILSWLALHGCYVKPANGYHQRLVTAVEVHGSDRIIAAMERLDRAGMTRGDTRGFVFGALDLLNKPIDIKALQADDRAKEREVARRNRPVDPVRVQMRKAMEERYGAGEVYTPVDPGLGGGEQMLPREVPGPTH